MCQDEFVGGGHRDNPGYHGHVGVGVGGEDRQSRVLQSGRRATPPTMAPPSPPRPPPPAKRKGARRLLRAATVRSRSRRACASAPHTTCRKGPPIPQARVAPAPDLRLLGKRSL